MSIRFILIVGRAGFVENYKNAVASAGYIPVVTDSSDLLAECKKHPTGSILSRMDLLLLPGGGDISPDLFHEKNLGSYNIDRDLDRLQFSYLDYFLLQKKPVLGICKGMQIINAKLGGALIQDMNQEALAIHAYLEKEDNRHGCSYVPLNEFENFPMLPVLKCLYKSPLLPAQINSAHHQCVHILPKELLPFQYSSDGVVEGFFHGSLPVIGLQWHPERLFCPEGSFLKLFLDALLFSASDKAALT